MQSRLRKRYRSERLFKLLGLAAVAISLAFLAFLLGTMIWRGAGGLTLDFLQASDSTDPAMAGVEMRSALQVLARDFDAVAVPDGGKYVEQPTRAEDGSAYDKA